ncbi:MAG: branched-chain amino acid ABC transporter permease [Anaerolineales bacterium]|jgi:branched-chain amino acid transport system permease protein
MEAANKVTLSRKARLGAALRKVWAPFRRVPLLSWLLGALAAVAMEQLIGTQLAWILGLSKIPALFGFVVVLETVVRNLSAFPGVFVSVLIYVSVIYMLPVLLVARLTTRLANRIAGFLMNRSFFLAVIVHLVLLYATLHIWSGISDYRIQVVRLTLIAIIVTLSLNLVNGYMGEFSCSHPGFMALGAYAASVFTLVFFVDDRLFGAPLLPASMGPFMFPLGLIVGGLVASLGAILVAIPSFKTRGDYLAIISLAFMFIVKSLFENLEVVGGPRGMGGQPEWASLPVVFGWAILAVWIINNFVRSTVGKAMNAVRDGEGAAEAMTVNTQKTKMVTFLFAAFWAGVAGGLLAHVISYVNPGSFGIQKLAEVLAMVYFGGLNSVVGSVVGAVGYSVLSEALRPLAIYKWIIIPVLLILVMIFRPTGLIAFKEFDVAKLIAPKGELKEEEEVEYAPIAD